MKKILFLLVVCLLFVGCGSQINNYKKISDIVVDLYRSPIYSTKGLSKTEKKLINEFLVNLRSQGELINIEKFINYDSPKVNEPDSIGVTIKDDVCYFDSAYLDFSTDNSSAENTEGKIEDEIMVICKGYIIFLIKNVVNTGYEDLIKNPKYNYQYLGYAEFEDYYKFYYQSLYDKSGFSVTLKNKDELEEINVEFEDVENVEYNSKLPNNNYMIYILLAGFCITIVIILVKRKAKL